MTQDSFDRVNLSFDFPNATNSLPGEGAFNNIPAHGQAALFRFRFTRKNCDIISNRESEPEIAAGVATRDGPLLSA
jgi:hypothetical protein